MSRNAEESQFDNPELGKQSKWFAPIAYGFFIVSLIWLIIDVETNVYVWDTKGSYFIDRIKALLIIIICSCINTRIRQHIIRKYAVKKNRVKEYALVIASSATIFNLALLFISYIINRQGFSLNLMVKGNAVGIPLIMVFYYYQRSKIFNAYYTQQSLQFEKMKSQQYSTELDYLKAQYHPHFLFNALNTVYFQIDEKNDSAKHTVELLSSLLRYQIYDIRNQVTLEQEIEHLKNYIEFQKMRMSEQLKLDLSVDISQPKQMLHPLLFQPLIENAFKYVRGDQLLISCSIIQTPKNLQFAVKNTIAALYQQENKRHGIGISNLKRRLELLYPQKYTLKFEQTEALFSAMLTIETNN